MGKGVKVRKVGNSLGVILPRDLLEALDVEEGDTLFPARTEKGVELTPYDPDFETVMDSNRDYMRRHRNALRELAKR
jgi:putative addiction module antidote